MIDTLITFIIMLIKTFQTPTLIFYYRTNIICTSHRLYNYVVFTKSIILLNVKLQINIFPLFLCLKNNGFVLQIKLHQCIFFIKCFYNNNNVLYLLEDYVVYFCTNLCVLHLILYTSYNKM